MASAVSIPQWASCPWLRAGFSTRVGGHTTAYGLPNDLNLGWTPEDDPAIVARNRQLLLEAVLGPASPARLVTMRQVHGNTVLPVDPTQTLTTPEGQAVLQADGLITAAPGIVLGVQTADCVPVLLADTRTRAVAALHAGWRGTLARIVESGIAAMATHFGTRPQDILAAIGPAILPCCLQVGPEVRAAFTRVFPYALELFPRTSGLTDTSYLDLHTANRRQLLDAGVPASAITLIAECTACHRLPNGHPRYFSYRAERARTGRMISLIATLA